MDHLLPVGWTDVATKQDLSASRLMTKADLDQTSAQLRTETADLRTEIRTDMADLRVEIHKAFRTQTIALVGLMFAMMSLYTGLILNVRG